MKKSTPSWNKKSLFICTKCEKEIDSSGYKQKETIAENLKNYLKEKLRSTNLNKDYRVMTSSCLGTCPKGEQAVLLLNSSDEKKSEVIICHPENERDDIFDYLTKNS